MFILRGTGNRICTMDCGGGGSAMRTLPKMAATTHTVLLGGKPIGSVDIAALQADPKHYVAMRS